MSGGIDYGMGKTNIDKSNGIRYGVINMNALNDWAWESFEDKQEPTCGHCGNPATAEEDLPEEITERADCDGEYWCEHCELALSNDEVWNDEAHDWQLDSEGYVASIDSYNDVFLVKSPYLTFAPFCSPCAPGAGHLGSAADHYEKEGLGSEYGVKTYCFGHDWFEGGIAPYPVYSVETGELVASDKKETGENE